MTSSQPPGPSSAPRPDGSPEVIQETLARFRGDLYGGRGPGISEAEWLANTSLRRSVAGVPTATSREQLHLRTLRARGELEAAAAQATWAATQFRTTSESPDRREIPSTAPDGGAGDTRSPSATARRLLAGAGWLAASVLWVRARQRRKHAA